MADERPDLPPTHSRGLLRRLLPLVLVIPLVAVPVIGYLLVSTGSQESSIPVAQGAIGGSFHPVAGNFQPDSTTLDECRSRFICLEQAFGNIAYRQGPKRALAVFGDRVDKDTAVQQDCHRIVHTIGSATYARFDGNIARTFAAGSSICASGYYHGILERAFVGLTTKAELGAAARKLCLSAGIRRRSFLDYQCRHGLGHGFMIQTGYALPTALSLCSELGTGWDEVTCTSGAFMENVSTRFGYRSSYLNEKDLLYPCDSIQLRYRRSCYVRSTTWILQVDSNDFADAARVCRTAGTKWAPYCFRGFGRDAVVVATYSDTKKVYRLCRLTGSYQGECLYGAARTFSDGSALNGVKLASTFCANGPRAQRDACVSGYGIYVGLLYPTNARRRAACARLAGDWAAACSTAAIEEVDASGKYSWG